MPERMRVEVGPDQEVIALVYHAAKPDLADITLILGHGAGADQTSGFMTKFAAELAARGVKHDHVQFSVHRAGPARYEQQARSVFPGRRRDNSREKTGPGPLVIGGKSMGGRIASQIAAAGSLNVEGLVFLGYPRHPPGKVDQLRAKHLSDIKVPMLFIQGSRDTFGTPDELRPIIKTLKAPADLYVVAGGDHSFKVLKRTGVLVGPPGTGKTLLARAIAGEVGSTLFARRGVHQCKCVAFAATAASAPLIASTFGAPAAERDNGGV